jgi:hypothetical protein
MDHHHTLHYTVTVTTVDSSGVSACLEYADTYTDPAAARAALQRRVDRNPWAVLGHVRLILGDPADTDTRTVAHETVWPTDPAAH